MTERYLKGDENITLKGFFRSTAVRMFGEDRFASLIVH